ncbi:hypothetical protein K32_17720 [Kaistia sp. 32K]|uniref:DUF2332 domain-containing protein n=1 Tax=Kaistia sp. 32K TaxID=2795690 RepID=UPI001915DEC0|nr:DUF2332 family protein [Kaistia sp. 32K]BCP53155.1 hypothetical protein K32_17720 [Kaistia sp. 32K]
MAKLTGDRLQAFERQAAACRSLGSPFTADVCEILAERLDETSRFGRRILDWPGNPVADALALRAAAGFHALKRAGRSDALLAAYPPAPTDRDALADALASAITENDDFLHDWLDSPPQTNEVARSSVLLGGALILGQEIGLPLAWYEIGASMGLNLGFDRYRYALGALDWGTTDSTVQIRSEWRGATPDTGAPLRIADRAGCDVSPLDPGSKADRERLLAYIWADQAERLARAGAALDVAASAPWRVEKADAVAWVARRFAPPSPAGVARVLVHTIMWQYLPEATQSAVTATLQAAGRSATAEAPVAWLRMEADSQPGTASVRLTIWPDGSEREIGRADFHGRFVDWLAR